ncbi:MAG: AAA family ATPase [Prevotellaceae bacterium]|jgi:AAA15 family ATPase/GTPase|nr:AAA family ATPase [Prevotellaceae bacterium]
MIQLESLKVKNFRGFDSLELNGFSKVNVLLGENNSGKTSVLESVFLLSGMSNPELALNINRMRGMSVSKSSIKNIFYNLDPQNKLLITGDFSGNINREVEIAPIFEKNIVSREVEMPARENPLPATSLAAASDILGLEYSFSIKRADEAAKPFKTWLQFERDGVKQMLSATYREDIVSTFLSPANVGAGLSEQLKTLFVARKEGVLNGLLNKLDSKIKGLYALPNGIYVDKEGISERIPLQLMGDGARRFLDIAATIAANDEQNFICLIDEIENGLHFRSQELAWQTLFNLIRAANVQLFITTHSWEMLQSLVNVLKQAEYVDMQGYVNVFSIVNTAREGFRSYVRSFEGLESSVRNGREFR